MSKSKQFTHQQKKRVSLVAIIIYALANLAASVFIWTYQATSAKAILVSFGTWLIGVAAAGLIVLFWRWLMHRKNGDLPSIDERNIQLLARTFFIMLCLFFVLCCAAVLALLFMGVKQVATTTLLMVLFWSILVMVGSAAVAFLRF